MENWGNMLSLHPMRKMAMTLWLLCCLQTMAQRQLTVVDVETLIPIAGVNVLGKRLSAQTDSLGHITLPDSCRTLSFSHVNYESRLLNITEIRDTVYLISKLLNLKEVVVFGKAKYTDKYKELQKRLRISKQEAQLLAANPSSGGNLLPLLAKLIPKKWRKNKKMARKERLKRILEEY